MLLTIFDVHHLAEINIQEQRSSTNCVGHLLCRLVAPQGDKEIKYILSDVFVPCVVKGPHVFLT